MLYASTNQVGTDIYIVDADADITDEFPSAINLDVGFFAELQFVAGSYDIYVTPTGEKTVITGPYRMDLALGDIFDIIVLDNLADPAIVDILPIPLP